MHAGDDLSHYLVCSHVMFEFLRARCPMLHRDWAFWGSPPLLPLPLLSAIGFGGQETVQLALIWLDFLTFSYAEAKHTSRFKFKTAWAARVRVIKRLSNAAAKSLDEFFR